MVCVAPRAGDELYATTGSTYSDIAACSVYKVRTTLILTPQTEHDSVAAAEYPTHLTRSKHQGGWKQVHTRFHHYTSIVTFHVQKFSPVHTSLTVFYRTPRHARQLISHPLAPQRAAAEGDASRRHVRPREAGGERVVNVTRSLLISFRCRLIEPCPAEAHALTASLLTAHRLFRM